MAATTAVPSAPALSPLFSPKAPLAGNIPQFFRFGTEREISAVSSIKQLPQGPFPVRGGSLIVPPPPAPPPTPTPSAPPAELRPTTTPPPLSTRTGEACPVQTLPEQFDQQMTTSDLLDLVSDLQQETDDMLQQTDILATTVQTRAGCPTALQQVEDRKQFLAKLYDPPADELAKLATDLESMVKGTPTASAVFTIRRRMLSVQRMLENAWASLTDICGIEVINQRPTKDEQFTRGIYMETVGIPRDILDWYYKIPSGADVRRFLLEGGALPIEELDKKIIQIVEGKGEQLPGTGAVRDEVATWMGENSTRGRWVARLVVKQSPLMSIVEKWLATSDRYVRSVGEADKFKNDIYGVARVMLDSLNASRSLIGAEKEDLAWSRVWESAAEYVKTNIDRQLGEELFTDAISTARLGETSKQRGVLDGVRMTRWWMKNVLKVLIQTYKNIDEEHTFVAMSRDATPSPKFGTASVSMGGSATRALSGDFARKTDGIFSRLVSGAATVLGKIRDAGQVVTQLLSNWSKPIMGIIAFGAFLYFYNTGAFTTLFAAAADVLGELYQNPSLIWAYTATAINYLKQQICDGGSVTVLPLLSVGVQNILHKRNATWQIRALSAVVLTTIVPRICTIAGVIQPGPPVTPAPTATTQQFDPTKIPTDLPSLAAKGVEVPPTPSGDVVAQQTTFAITASPYYVVEIASGIATALWGGRGITEVTVEPEVRLAAGVATIGAGLVGGAGSLLSMCPTAPTLSTVVATSQALASQLATNVFTDLQSAYSVFTSLGSVLAGSNI